MPTLRSTLHYRGALVVVVIAASDLAYRRLLRRWVRDVLGMPS